MWTILLAALTVAPCTTNTQQTLQNPASEVRRIQHHLDGALEMLESADTSHLTKSQRTARARAIANLHEYRDAGQFPINNHFKERTPYFRDDFGTLCAMAYLIEKSGRTDIVDYVERTQNNARVYEMADEPALVEWLETNGMTLAEAARVQPEYNGPPAPNVGCFCKENIVGVLDAVMSATDDDYEYEARVRDVHGETGSWQVNDMIMVQGGSLTIGQRALVPVYDSGNGPEYYGMFFAPLDENERVGCSPTMDTASWGLQRGVCYPDLKMHAETAVYAMLYADNCSRFLRDQDPRWTRTCEGAGCGLSGQDGSHTHWPLILLVLGVPVAVGGACKRLRQ